MHRDFRKPLVVMTPKSLLRHKKCVSNLNEFTTKKIFRRVLDDDAYINNSGLIKLRKDNEIKKVIMCSGKIYFDLLEAREQSKNESIVFIRVEQLYPFPAKTLAKILKRYKSADFFWCQEEPKNMGAWNTVRNYIDRILEIINYKNNRVKYIGRDASSTTATGNYNKHLAEQKKILEKVVRKSN
jgi:2-oxoglutarate dehydrogenase E1 component